MFVLCSDVDWCAVAGCGQLCAETAGGVSFVCSCDVGFLLNDDAKTCRGESVCGGESECGGESVVVSV